GAALAAGQQGPEAAASAAPPGTPAASAAPGAPAPPAAGTAAPAPRSGAPGTPAPAIDRTAKLYIGGKQSRPDSDYSLDVLGADGRRVGEVGRGNRKDIRNAVEAAHQALPGWAGATAHNRAQVLYYVAENLAARAGEFARRVDAMTGAGEGAREVELAVRRLFAYAAWADKWDGAVHHTPFRNVTLAMPEPLGVVGVVCPERWPLLGFVSAVFPAVSLGNAVVAVPSEPWPLAATDLYQVLDTSDLPGGVVNIVTGPRAALTETLAGHYDVDGLWHFGPEEEGALVERLAAGNMKRTWVDHGLQRDWADPVQGEGTEFLRRATQVKNIWVPYGE
ncbi:MAG: aldehyde dehydrogenase family protein, partial [Gemmatimonadetes bacterium]|nr:aldehyde dehydrogenase family protein [Gemmatimonadota bacterium]